MVTWTVNSHVFAFPDESVKVYNTVVRPGGKRSPGTAVLPTVTGGGSESSVAKGGGQDTETREMPSSITSGTVLGQPNTWGGIVSTENKENDYSYFVYILISSFDI